MHADEALGLAQILLGLLLFTVGIPALIIEVRVEESLRRLLHKRMQQKRMVRLGAFTLGIVGILIILSETPAGPVVRILLKTIVMLLITYFADVWVDVYKSVKVDLVVKDIVAGMKRQVRGKAKVASDDLNDLVVFGEHLNGAEKMAVLEALGDLCGETLCCEKYDGSQLEPLLQGLQRVVIRNGTQDHHLAARSIVGKSWRVLSQGRMARDRDSSALKEVSCVLGSLAVSREMASVSLLWMSSVPGAAGVPYRIGIAALQVREFTVAIQALTRLYCIAAYRNALPKKLIGIVAHFYACGPSARQTARDLLDMLGLSTDSVREAASIAAAAFRDKGDYSTADAIGAFLEAYP